jgi:Domain of unknown function (DUF397)
MKGGAGVDARDLRRAQWRTSTYSGGNGSCVEVADNLPGVVLVRDSKNRQGPQLTVTGPAWSAFVQGIKHGEFDS